jgi:hypothetical protein
MSLFQRPARDSNGVSKSIRRGKKEYTLLWNRLDPFARKSSFVTFLRDQLSDTALAQFGKLSLVNLPGGLFFHYFGSALQPTRGPIILCTC